MMLPDLSIFTISQSSPPPAKRKLPSDKVAIAWKSPLKEKLDQRGVCPKQLDIIPWSRIAERIFSFISFILSDTNQNEGKIGIGYSMIQEFTN